MPNQPQGIGPQGPTGDPSLSWNYIVVNSLTGPTGPAGPSGSAGLQGPQGPSGFDIFSVINQLRAQIDLGASGPAWPLVQSLAWYITGSSPNGPQGPTSG